MTKILCGSNPIIYANKVNIMNQTFELTDKQVEKIKKFHPKCKKKYTGSIGGGMKYIFEPTGLGNIETFICVCGKELDLTDVSKW